MEIVKDETLVAEEVTENVEQTTEETVVEQPPKMFTQEEVNEIVGKSKARTRAKVEREYDRKYGGLVDVLKAGTGAESVEDATEKLTKFYQSKGIKLPQKPSYTDADNEVLARAEADDIIRAGFDEVVDEVDRLANVGVANMTPREKMVFKALAEHRQSEERIRELSSIGVPESVYNSAEFKAFAGQFNETASMTDVYKLYEKTAKTSNVEAIGSMKNGSHGEEKTYYSPEDVDKLTSKDLDNPVIFQRVRESMKRW